MFLNGLIIVRLSSGLGNQLFQYAAARSLAIRLDRCLKLDATWYRSIPERKAHRVYVLNSFNIKEDFAGDREIRKARGTTLAARIMRRIRGGDRRRGFKTVDSREAFFDTEALQSAACLYLNGFWQSEDYFAESAELIRQELAFRNPPSQENKEWLERIKGCESVCIHVRRGDYVQDPKIAAILGVCSPQYYTAAVAMVREKTKDPRFFVFSDDVSWVKSNLMIKGPVDYITHNADDPVEDLRLMSGCRHFIMANSSFSWWAAWLQAAPGLVIAPRPWFRDPSRDDARLVPERWTRLPA